MSGAVSTKATADALAKAGNGGVAVLVVDAATWDKLTPGQRSAITAATGGGKVLAVTGLNSGTQAVIRNIDDFYKWLNGVGH
ncbi:MAG TPA: hypothetical protein VMH80_01535 [Bryobacteraceae bacterium]|nr:hypothetical protein [Bryobacteraceae bacterium]